MNAHLPPSRIPAPRFVRTALTAALLAAPFSSHIHAAAISAGASGDWSSTGTWTGGVVPVSGDTVTIGDTYIVTLPSGSAASGNITVQAGGNLTISGGSLTLDTGAWVVANGDVFLSDGTLTQSTAVNILQGSGTFTMTGGNFTYNRAGASQRWYGTIDISGGNLTWNTRPIGATSYAGAILNIDGDASSLFAERWLTNSSTRRATLNYTFGASGVSSITTAGSSDMSQTQVAVDGTNYTGGEGSFTLMSGVSVAPVTTTPTASNFTGYNATFGLGSGNYQLTLTSYSTVWDGGGGDTNINTAANWADDLTPNLTNGHNSFTFGTGGSTATINTNLNAAGIVLNRASSFEIASGAGSLTVGSGGVTSSGAAHTISEGVILGADQTWDVTDSLTVSGAVSGAYNLTKAGAGTLTLSNTNTYTGSTTVNAGTLAVSGNIASSDLILNSGGIISPGTTAAADSFGTSSITINGGGYNWTLNTANGSAGTGYDQITSTGALTSSGLLTVYAYGTPGDWDGSASYDWDIFNAGSVSGFSAGNFSVDLNNFGIAPGNRTGTWSFSNPSGGIIRLTYTPSADPAWNGGSGNFSTGFDPTVSNGNSVFFAGASGGTATNDSYITSLGNMTFMGGIGAYTIEGSAFTVTGAITNNEGSNTQTLNTNVTPGSIVINAGTLEIGAVGRLSSGAYTGTITNEGTFLFSGTTAQTLSGVISGSGGLTKNGSATLTLSGANTYTGTTAINAGTLTLGADQSLGVITGAGALNLFSYTLTTNSSIDTTFSGVISGSGGLTKNGTGTLTLTAANTYSGATTINAGTIEIGAAGRLGAGTYAGNIANNGTLIYSGTSAQTLSGVISGSGGLTKNASSTLTLSGANTYSGTTTLNAGTVQINHANALGSGGDVTFSGGELNYGTGVSTDLSARIKNSGSAILVDTNGETVTWGTNLASTNTGGLTKNGTGTLRINVGSAYAGGTTINGGTLQIHNTAGTTGWGPGAIAINNGSTLEYTGTQQTIVQGAGDNITFDSGGGGSIIMSVNTIWRSSSIITTGGAMSTVSGSAFNGQSSYNVIYETAVGTDAVALEVSSNHSDIGITKTGLGKIVLTNTTNGMSRAIVIDAGVLEIGGAGRLKSGIYNLNITNNGTFSYNSTADQTLSGVISGTGALTKNAASALTLTGSNTYSGGTTLNTGTLVIGNAAAAGTGTITQTDGTSVLKLDTTGTIANAMSIYNVVSNQSVTLSGAITAQNTTYDVASGTTLSINGSIGGSGGVTKDGDGTLELNAANTFTGDTEINFGTLEANATGSLANTGNIRVNGGSLLVGASNAINDSAAMELAGGNLTFSGNINETVGALTLSANSVIDMGGGNVALEFSNLVTQLTSTTQLKIYNYTLYSDHLYFTSNANVSDSLQYISFYSDFGSSFIGNSFISSFSSPWQVQPVPEPETWATAAILLIGGGVWMFRRKRHGSGQSRTPLLDRE